MKSFIGYETLKVMEKADHYNEWLFLKIKPYLGINILEVGAGIGTFTSNLFQNAESVTVLDINANYLKIIKSELSSPRLKIIKGDIQKEKLLLGKYDTAVCLNVLEHLENDERALKNIYKSVKKNGNLILLVPAHQSLYGSLDKSLGHQKRYNIKEIRRLLKKVGFKTQKIEYFNMAGAAGWLINSKIFGKNILPENQVGFFNKICVSLLKFEEFISPPFGLSVLAIGKKL